MSRVISGAQEGHCRRWDVPELAHGTTGAPYGTGTAAAGHLTAGELDAVGEQARKEGFEQGYREGLEAGRQALAQRLEHLDRLMQALARPFEELDKQVEEDLLELAVAIARQLLRGEYEAAPGRVTAVVRDAIGLLPAAARTVRLRLHPEDAALVRESMDLPDAARDWRLVEDPSVTRGGCLVDSETVRVDASLEARLETLLASMTADEVAGEDGP